MGLRQPFEKTRNAQTPTAGSGAEIAHIVNAWMPTSKPRIEGTLGITANFNGPLASSMGPRKIEVTGKDRQSRTVTVETKAKPKPAKPAQRAQAARQASDLMCAM